MEVVNTTTVGLRESISFLLERGGLEKIIGHDSCACFVVTTPLHTPEFFDQLITNVATIDATTRSHIAFIVFYGESTVYARASDYHAPYQKTQAKIKDISFSTRHEDRFDETYARLFRDEPGNVNRSRFSYNMTRFADAIMEYYSLKESDLPCIIFADPADRARHLTMELR